MPIRTLKNISGKEINVLLKARSPNEVFTVELPQVNKWSSETYLLSKVYEIDNLIFHKYIEVIKDDNPQAQQSKDSTIESQQSMLGKFGYLPPIKKV